MLDLQWKDTLYMFCDMCTTFNTLVSTDAKISKISVLSIDLKGVGLPVFYSLTSDTRLRLESKSARQHQRPVQRGQYHSLLTVYADTFLL